MTKGIKLFFVFVCLSIFINKTMAQTAGINLSHDGHQKQLDSLLNEVNHNNDMNQLGLLVLYEQAANSKHPDSVNIFKKLALLNADLEQPKDAYKYTLKYIYNTFDFSILKDNSFKPIKETDEYKKLNDLFSFKIDGLCFFYFYAALIGFFFTIVINFSKKAKPYSRVLIATFVGIQSLFILEFVLYATNLRYQYPHTYRLSSACVLLLGPVIYFYFKSVSPNFKFKPKDALHLLPSLCLLFFLLPVYLASANEKYSMMLGLKASTYSYNVVVFLAKVVSLIIYSFFIWRLFKANRYSEIYKNAAFKRKWEAGIFNVYIAYIISYVLYGLSILTELGNISIIIYNAMVGLMCFMLIYIVYLGYVQSDVFNNTFVPLNKRLFSKKYQKSGLTSTLSTELKENLEKLLVQDKVFKENNINLELLAFKLNTTRHNASQIINEHFKMNFFELINSFRIKEAIKILEEDSHGNLNIIDIAYEVGYNNKVTFNKAFKKVTKTTPSHYINTLLTNSTSK